MMTINAATLLRQSSVFKDHVMMEIDTSCSPGVTELSRQPLAKWQDRIVPPFDYFILTLDYAVIQPDQTHVNISVTMVHSLDYTGFVSVENGKLKRYPFEIVWGDAQPKMYGHANVAEIAWGTIPYKGVKFTGNGDTPPDHIKVGLTQDPRDFGYDEEGCQQWMWQSGFMVRMFSAAMALLNNQRETIVLPASYRVGKTYVDGKFIPKYKPHVVVIQPNAPRIIIERDPNHVPTERHYREHDVRAHTRTLKSGRVVPVRSFTRGDASVGRVEKSYKIEMDPLASMRAVMAKNYLSKEVQ